MLRTVPWMTGRYLFPGRAFVFLESTRVFRVETCQRFYLRESTGSFSAHCLQAGSLGGIIFSDRVTLRFSY